MGMEGIIAKDGVLTVELARQGRKLFDFDITVAEGWPTSGAVVRPYPPTRVKTVQRDAAGRLSVIRETVG